MKNPIQAKLLEYEIERLNNFLKNYPRSKDTRAYKMLTDNLKRKKRFLREAMYSKAAIDLFGENLD